MSTYTTHYNLDKYEGTDRPNLRDQYNAAMDKIDNALNTQAGNIAAAATTAATAASAAATADAKAVTAQGDATTALNLAGQAQADANAASYDANLALTQLDGNSIHIITRNDFNKWFSIPAGSYVDPAIEYEIEGIAIQNPTHTTMLVNIHAHTRILQAADWDTMHPLFEIKDLKSTEITDASVVSLEQFSYPVEVHVKSNNPSMIQFVTYSGGSPSYIPPYGLTISANLILQLVPR